MHGVKVGPFARDLPSPIPTHPAEHLLTPERAQRFRQVLARRTGRIAVVIEECYDPQNATAVVRTCDALGIHRVHVVTNKNTFKVNRRVSQGSHLNVDLRSHKDITEAYAELRADGFHIVVTDLTADAAIGPAALNDLVNERPLAVVFGNEGHGLSDAAKEGADGAFLIPMVGFPQSLNLSVSAAVSLYALRQQALVEDSAGDLSQAEQCRWFDLWVRRQKSAAKVMNGQATDWVEGLDRRGETVDIAQPRVD